MQERFGVAAWLNNTFINQRARGLAEAAREHQAALVPFYFYKLTESCVGCHARYAGHRFPGYAQPPEAKPAHAH